MSKLPFKHIDTRSSRFLKQMHGAADHEESTNLDNFLILGTLVLVTVAGVALFLGKGSPLVKEMLSSMITGFPIIIASAVMLMIGMFLNSTSINRRSNIKILDATDTGITIGREKYTSEECAFIPWSEVAALEAIKLPGKKDAESTQLFLSTTDSLVYQFYWSNAFSWVDEETLLTRLRTEAPDAKVSWDIGRLELARDNARYTDLWLQYFTAPDQRKRRSTLTEGTVLQDGRYRVIGKLGGGGQGTTYIATCASEMILAVVNEQSVPSDTVVLKEYILPVYRGLDLENEKYALLNQEAKILSEIDHPRIVRLLDCFVEDHRGYLVLEHIAGEPLRQIVNAQGPLDQVKVLELGAAICEIMEYLHGQATPIIHRDITPENLILRQDGLLKIVDFTVAHQLCADRTATVVGKQSYMPAEQFRGLPSPESDIYAAGCCLHFLLTGQEPQPMEPSQPKEIVSTIDDQVNLIVRTATQFEPQDRYRYAADMRAAIEQVQLG